TGETAMPRGYWNSPRPIPTPPKTRLTPEGAPGSAAQPESASATAAIRMPRAGGEWLTGRIMRVSIRISYTASNAIDCTRANSLKHQRNHRRDDHRRQRQQQAERDDSSVAPEVNLLIHGHRQASSKSHGHDHHGNRELANRQAADEQRASQQRAKQ